MHFDDFRYLSKNEMYDLSISTLTKSSTTNTLN